MISKIMQDNFVQTVEMHPTPQDLSTELYDLKNRDEYAYDLLQKSFTEIFHNTTIKVEPRPNDGEQTILITDNQRTLEITDSASGHLETIYILHTILNHTGHTIFLDEPELHFHPAKIRQISQTLQSLIKNNSNQVTVITHSPNFIDHRLLDPNSAFTLTMVTKDNDESKVASPRNTKLKSHLIVPDVFFANAVFLVEGASDKSVITAISDSYNGAFNKHEIVIMDCGGVRSIKPHIDFLKAYSIKCYGMADKQYKHGGTITVLDENLEAELNQIASMPFQNYTQPKYADVYYQYITELLKTESGREELKQTKIWSSLENVMNGIDVGMKDFEDEYKT